jgi:hypothetical protein
MTGHMIMENLHLIVIKGELVISGHSLKTGCEIKKTPAIEEGTQMEYSTD